MMKNYKNFILMNELDFNIINTLYNPGIIPKTTMIYYEFLSKKGNSYRVYFRETYENDFKLNDNTYLSDYINLNNIIPTIFFSATERGFDPLTFDLLTKRNEQLDVLGRVVFLILEFINNHPKYNVYSIGEVPEKKFNFYDYYRKYFSNFDLKIGETKNYKDKNNNNTKAYYLIKKSNKNDEI